MNNSTERDITVDMSALSELSSAVRYQLYTDDDAVPTKTHVRVTEKTIRRMNKKNSRLNLHLKANGGATMIISTK